MKYRKRPIVVEAIQFTGANRLDMKDFCPSLVTRGIDDSGAEYTLRFPRVQTPEGEMLLREGYWLIKGIQGEFYPCDPNVFAATYDPVT